MTVDPDRRGSLAVWGSRRTQLDGLRTLAVLGVLVQHGLGLVGDTGRNGGFALGSVGVRLFFVLSGFLITGILLRERANAERRDVSVWVVWRAFYCRRALRILPLGYLAFAVGWTLGSPSAMAHPWHFITYTSNYFVAREGLRDPSLDHFWSLAVEEQFYLVWPFLILIVSESMLWQAMAGVVVAATVARTGVLTLYGVHAAYVLTISRLDSLAVGGLLAWVSLHHPGTRKTVVLALFVVGALVRGIAVVAAPGLLTLPLPETGYVLVSAAIVLWADLGMPGPIGALLGSRPAVAVGTVSYGVYVYHMLIAGLAPIVASRLGVADHFPTAEGWPRFLAMIATTLPIAGLSWQYFERPLNDMKRRFPYVPGAAATRKPEEVLSPASMVATSPGVSAD